MNNDRNDLASFSQNSDGDHADNFRFSDALTFFCGVLTLKKCFIVRHFLKRYHFSRKVKSMAMDRRSQGLQERASRHTAFFVKARNGQLEPFNISLLEHTIAWAVRGYESDIDMDAIIEETLKNSYDGINTIELADALILGAIACIERDPAYGYCAARLLLKKLFREVTNNSISKSNVQELYRASFIQGIHEGVANGSLDKRLLDFDLNYLAEQLSPSHDFLFDFMGLRTLYERYFVKKGKVRNELPQSFWMRIAMGLSYNESDKNEKAAAFYRTISQMDYVPGTPTLLHAGTHRPQLSSCFLTTVPDDLTAIFKCLGDNAQLSKWSGGVANDWTPLRATGAYIKSIKTESQGVIPFLKIANDVTAAINRSGSRRGATCVYLETWHLDIEDFLDLRKNTGDERRRTHDINIANWIPDLFMKRVIEDKTWTLFSPDETPELHDLYGKAFEEKYCAYEEKARAGHIALYKEVSALALWRKMLSRLFESGHPWMTWKDAFNIRSPQDHAGVIHSSNLCTEISLPTSADETAVCNLGSVNLAHFVNDGVVDDAKLAATVTLAIRMLDNVIDINFYPTIEAQNANLRHRPIGLGIMGLQDALYKLDIPFDDPRALQFSDEIMEKIAYHAIMASSQLAQERGAYTSFKGSKWDKGIFPQDTVDLLQAERGMPIEVARGGKLDWSVVRAQVSTHGMRNSNTMAIAPTATISTISGCYPCIEPIYKNIYVKANMSGEFTVVNSYLVKDLKKLDLWNQDMLDQLKYFDGSVQYIPAIPDHIKNKYKEVFEIDPLWLIDITAARGKWIDQSQSHNVFMKGVSGKLLNDIYIHAWKKGLKSTYYLRTLGASQIEKSTLDAKKFGFTQKREYVFKQEVYVSEQFIQSESEEKPTQSCSLSSDPECETCQ